MPRRLIDDCFLHDKDRLRHAEALGILRDRLGPVVGTETVPLSAALDRLLAAPVTAKQPVPLADNAAVDGYAFSHDAFEASGGVFPIGARIAAGMQGRERLAPGTAARIFTGAPMPEGADTVAMQEDCTVEDGAGPPRVVVPPGLKAGANRRLAGEDVAAGDRLLSPGARLRPHDIAAIASVGQATVEVFRPLRVALISTGDELVRVGGRLEHGQVFDSNSPLLSALLANLPVRATDMGVLADDAALVSDTLAKAAAGCDLVLTSGGASRGDEDHLVSAIDRLGTHHLWQLAIKPGRPMSFGQIGDCAVMSLPGNPVAVFVCFLLYVRPAILALAGGHWPEPAAYSLPAAFEIARKKPDRREFLRATLVREEGLAVAADKFARDGSGLISGLRAADGLVELPEEAVRVAKGDPVRFLPFSEFGIAPRAGV